MLRQNLSLFTTAGSDKCAIANTYHQKLLGPEELGKWLIDLACPANKRVLLTDPAATMSPILQLAQQQLSQVVDTMIASSTIYTEILEKLAQAFHVDKMEMTA